MRDLLAPGFETVLQEVDPETLESETSTVVGLRPDLIERLDLRISHTLCRYCRDLFWNV